MSRVARADRRPALLGRSFAGRDRVVESALDIPVLGNGDVWEAEDALRMTASTCCDGVVIGRGCPGDRGSSPTWPPRSPAAPTAPSRPRARSPPSRSATQRCSWSGGAAKGRRDGLPQARRLVPEGLPRRRGTPRRSGLPQRPPTVIGPRNDRRGPRPESGPTRSCDGNPHRLMVRPGRYGSWQCPVGPWRSSRSRRRRAAASGVALAPSTR